MPLRALGTFLQGVPPQRLKNRPTIGLNALTGSGDFSTIQAERDNINATSVSMPLRALGTFLRNEARLVVSFSFTGRSQCPYGLWGLFYVVEEYDINVTNFVSMPLRALGTFLPEIAKRFLEAVLESGSQCPYGLWGLFYP